MNAEDWSSWRADPRTKAFFKYVQDRRASVMEAWAHGAQDEHAQSRCVELSWILNIEHADIEQFYEDEDEDGVESG